MTSPITAASFWILLGVAAAAGAGQRGAPVPAEDPRPVGRIAVTARGAISFDGMAVTMDTLEAKLSDLKKRGGVVWYYRERAAGEPPAAATDVIKLVVGNQLPISMSTKPDYSDVVLQDGTTRPRPDFERR